MISEIMIGHSVTSWYINFEGLYFRASEVEDAVLRLKPHKNEGSSELATDHFINGGRDCLSFVAFLLTAITVHVHVPDSFKRSTIVPIPKGHKVNKSDSTNFRESL